MTMRPGETQLWRLANIGADIWYDLQLEGHTFAVIGEDANPVSGVRRAGHLLLPPGKRYDVLVQAPRAGTFELVSRRVQQGRWGDTYPRSLMATLTVAGPAVSRVALPTRLGTRFDDLANAKVDVERRSVFSETKRGNGVYEVNGRVFAPQMVDYAPKLGTVEEWTVLNTSQEIHPFHIHVNDFQVMSVNGKPARADSLQDTVPLPVSRNGVPGKVVIRMRMRKFTGKYVFHCHILAHEDLGMMGVVNVS
jgi:suppressor of ftsI